MSLVDLLMVEHASLRLHFRYFREMNSDLIFELEDFISKSHSKVEDEIVFPRLTQLSPAEAELARKINRLIEDHELLAGLGENMRVWATEGPKELDVKRIGLYADTVMSHNASEEALVFPLWSTSAQYEAEACKNARSLIEGFGLDRYLRVTGISKPLLDSLLKPGELVNFIRPTTQGLLPNRARGRMEI